MKTNRFKVILAASLLSLLAVAFLGWEALRSMNAPKNNAPITAETKTALESKLGFHLPSDCIILAESDGGYNPAEYYEYVLQSKTGFVFDQSIDKLDMSDHFGSILRVFKSRGIGQECDNPVGSWSMRWMVGTYHISVDQLITKDHELLWITRSRK